MLVTLYHSCYMVVTQNSIIIQVAQSILNGVITDDLDSRRYVLIL